MHWIVGLACAGLTTAGVIALAIASTKPTKESFDVFYDNTKNPERKTGNLLQKVVANIIETAPAPNVKQFDLVIARVAVVQRDLNKPGEVYLGALGTWTKIE